MTSFRHVLRFTASSWLALGAAGAVGVESTARANGHGGRLEGTWNTQVRIVTCPPAPRLVLFTFASMVTYIDGGTAVEGGAPPAPEASRSAGHGIWERIGRRTFHTFNRFHSFDSLGRLVRFTEIDNRATLVDGDNPETPDVVEPYWLSGKATNEFINLDPVDGSIISVVAGCSESSARPMLFDD